ncbi:MAG: PPOX class F420-dependent oxidoreductase [Acidimicrobiia bacterium]|nr:PPOX class F420-dependent oxidoreductase [Acidimicrobiia bacterium]
MGRLDPTDLPAPARDFLAERHLATLTTARADGTPQVTPVGFTYEPARRLARVITFRSARKVANLAAGGHVALCQVDGARWLTLEGHATVHDGAARVDEAVARYAARYRTPGPRPDRVVIEIEVERVYGRP